MTLLTESNKFLQKQRYNLFIDGKLYVDTTNECFVTPDQPCAFKPADLIDHDAVTLIIRDRNGMILIQYHNKYKGITVPVGKVDPGKTIEQTVVEELKEETNLDVTRMKIVGVHECVYRRIVHTLDSEIPHKEVYDIWDFNDVDYFVHVKEYIIEVTVYDETIMKNNEPHKHAWQEWMDVNMVKYEYDHTMRLAALNYAIDENLI